MSDDAGYRPFPSLRSPLDISGLEEAVCGFKDVQGIGGPPGGRAARPHSPSFSPQDAKYHMQRCIDSGLWVPNSKSSEAKDGEEAGPGDPLLEAGPKPGDKKDVSA